MATESCRETPRAHCHHHRSRPVHPGARLDKPSCSRSQHGCVCSRERGGATTKNNTSEICSLLPCPPATLARLVSFSKSGDRSKRRVNRHRNTIRVRREQHAARTPPSRLDAGFVVPVEKIEGTGFATFSFVFSFVLEVSTYPLFPFV